MAQFDVFNGNADGICSLQQLRLAQPVDSELVTGVKRDIDLLKRVTAGRDDQVTVLDVSLDKNREPLLGLLEQSASVLYFDHHFPGDIPSRPGLKSHVETVPDKGISLLLNEYLGGSQRAWTVVGTFGDKFDAAARKKGADKLCRQFLSSGGRKAAAGIYCLKDDLYQPFVQAFSESF